MTGGWPATSSPDTALRQLMAEKYALTPAPNVCDRHTVAVVK